MRCPECDNTLYFVDSKYHCVTEKCRIARIMVEEKQIDA